MTRRRKGSKEDVLQADRRRERLEAVVKSYLMGKSVREIAILQKLTVQQVYGDIRLARKIWHKRNDRSADVLISEEIAKIDRIEAEAWCGWLKSQQDAEESSIENDPTGKAIKAVKKTKGQAGDAKFLAIALGCVDKRCKMLKIGEYSTDESANDVAPLVEIVVESQEQIASIMEYGDYAKLTAPSTN